MSNNNLLQSIPLLIKGDKSAFYKRILWCIIAIGLILRLFHYFNNRSLWEDEIYLSTGILHLSFTGLITQHLDFQQKAPIGYLLSVKLCTLLFGKREMGLRLFPLLCGIASLFVFIPVARYFLKSLGVLIAMAMLAFAPPLVYHSVEAKPYCTELFATILLLLAYIHWHKKTDLRSLAYWALSGAVIVWFSYSAVFILAGMAFVTGINCLLNKQWKNVPKLALVFIVWFGSFALNYLLFTAKGAHSGWLVYFFMQHHAFMPRSAGCIRWIVHKIFSFFNYPMGFSWNVVYNDSTLYQLWERMAWVPLILLVAGIYFCFKRDKILLSLVTVTFIIVFIASAFLLYPFHERLTVFLAPLMILLIAAGCQGIFGIRPKAYTWQWLLVLLLLAGPVKNSVAEVIDPGLFGDYKKSYHREALFYLNDHYKKGDLVYVYWNDLPAYRLYKQMYPLEYTAIEGRDYRYISHNFAEYFNYLERDIKPLEGKKRVWIVINNNFDIEIGDYVGHPVWYYQNDDGLKKVDQWLLSKGTKLEEFKLPDKKKVSNVSVFLMDLSKHQ